MSHQIISDRPLTKLTSMKSLRQVDSPRSTNGQETQYIPLIRKLTAPEHDHFNDLYSQDRQLQSALEFSIDDLFSKIEKITSQFTPSSDHSGSISSIYNQLEEVVPDSAAHCRLAAGQSLDLFMYTAYPNKITTQQVTECDPAYPQIQARATTESSISTNQQPVQSANVLSQKPQRITINHFELGKSIGSGKFGDVFQCRHKKSGTLYALKKIFKSTIREYNMVDQFTEQLKIHYSLQHPNIVRLYTHFQDEYHVFLLMEYIDGGMLMNYVKSDERFVSKGMVQILRAVDYLHRNQIAHRDIKPQNIVVTNGILKLCDFGWAANCQTGMKKTFCGTLDYVSPEILEEREYHLSVDLWSLGILTFELLAGFPPFQEQIPKLKMNLIKNVDKKSVLYPPQISNAARDFIGRFLKKDPTNRMTIRESYGHMFIKKHNLRQEDTAPEDIKKLFF